MALSRVFVNRAAEFCRECRLFGAGPGNLCASVHIVGVIGVYTGLDLSKRLNERSKKIPGKNKKLVWQVEGNIMVPS